jgi:hypothetical protein
VLVVGSRCQYFTVLCLCMLGCMIHVMFGLSGAGCVVSGAGNTVELVLLSPVLVTPSS